MAKKAASGAPLWMVTFADLMSILVCFFVLILSFSIMDIKRFYEVTGAVRNAFGVTEESLRRGMVQIVGSPMHENVEYLQPVIVPIDSPRMPDRAQAPNTQDGEAFGPGDANEGDAGEVDPNEHTAEEPVELDDARSDEVVALEEREEIENRERVIAESAAAQLADMMSEQLRREIDVGTAQVVRTGLDVTVTFPGEYSFEPGSDRLTAGFQVTLDRLSLLMGDAIKEVVVAGHTDNIPIATSRYRSNWDLSGMRSVSVVNYLSSIDYVDVSKLAARGYGDSRPIADNATAEGRSENRRVEVVFRPSDELLALVAGSQ